MRRRPAYTLLEVLLALSIAVLLLAALYAAMNYQLRYMQAGRDLMGQATLSRAILNRIGNDTSAAISLCDPARYRLIAFQNMNNSNSSSSSSGSSTTSGSSSGSMTSSSGGSSSNSSGSSSSGGSSSSSSSSSNGSTSSSSTSSSTSGVTPVVLPLGIQGDSTTLHLFVSRVPSEAYGPNPGDQGQLVGDLRRISYWVDTSDKGGLCRAEYKVISSQDALAQDPSTGFPALPSGDIQQYLLASEVRSVEFSYFDGTNWNDTWDSTTPGTDTMPNGTVVGTPIGSPRAVSIKIGVATPGAGNQARLKYYRHVVALTPANGTTPLQPTNDQTSSAPSGSSTGN